MLVDSFRFLPRSFAPLYATAEPLDGEAQPVWTPFERRLADARISLVTSAGLYLRDGQEPFDLDGERRDPTWGDPSHRTLPATTAPGDLGMAHLHVSDADVLADHNVALPSDVLGDLVDEGVVAGTTPHHHSVMGYQQAGLEVWRAETAPAIVARLREEGADGVVLAPV